MNRREPEDQERNSKDKCARKPINPGPAPRRLCGLDHRGIIAPPPDQPERVGEGWLAPAPLSQWGRVACPRRSANASWEGYQSRGAAQDNDKHEGQEEPPIDQRYERIQA
jgi:hypothetical protein